MKLRPQFVSNSSSTSFYVAFLPKDFDIGKYLKKTKTYKSEVYNGICSDFYFLMNNGRIDNVTCRWFSYIHTILDIELHCIISRHSIEGPQYPDEISIVNEETVSMAMDNIVKATSKEKL